MIVKKGKNWKVTIDTSAILKGRRVNTDHTQDVHEVRVVGDQWWPLYGYHLASQGKVPKVFNQQGKQVSFGDFAHFQLLNTRLLWPINGTEASIRVSTETIYGMDYLNWLDIISYDTDYQHVAYEWSLPIKQETLSMTVNHPWLQANAVSGTTLLSQFPSVQSSGMHIPSDVLFITATHNALLTEKNDSYQITSLTYPLKRDYFIRAYNLFHSGIGYHMANRLPHLGVAERLSFLWRDAGKQWQLGEDTDLSGI